MDFIQVIESGSVEKLQEFIDAEGLPKNDEWIDYDLLNHVLAKGQKESAVMLIERQCRVNNKPFAPPVDTPLHHAVKLGSIEIVELLLRKGALIHARNSEGETPVHLSAKLRNNIFTDLLLTSLNDAVDMNYMDSSGLTYLHIACIRSNLALIEKLLANNSDINHRINIDSSEFPGYTALHCAIEFYNLNAMQLLLSNNADVSVKAKNGWTPLHLAVKYGMHKYVKMLLRHSSNVVADINAQVDADAEEYSGFSVLHFAFQFQWPSIVKLLLRYKPNFNAKSTTGLTVLHIALKKDTNNLVRELLKYNVDVNCVELENNSTPLHLATLNKREEIVRVLLNLGAKVSAQQRDGSTPLHIAAYWSNDKKPTKKRTIFNFPFLFLHNEPMNESDESFQMRIHRDILDLLLTANDLFDANPVDSRGLSHFHIVCMCRGKDKVLKYLQKDIGIKERINDCVKKDSPVWPGYTALHFAVEYGKLNIVEVLLEYKADVRAVNAKRLTPIHLTAQLSDRTRAEYILKELLKTLYEEVASCEDPSKNHGLTTLHVTCMQEDKVICDDERDYDVEATVNFDSPVWPGCTPLHFATIFRRHKVMNSLLLCGAETNVEDSYGLTPLHIACLYSDVGMVSMLLEVETDVNCATKKNSEYAGKTPLHIAFGLKSPSLPIIHALLEKGANINAKDSNGDTPISVFAKNCAKTDMIGLINIIYICHELRLFAITLRAIKFRFSKTTAKALKDLDEWLRNINVTKIKYDDERKHLKHCLNEIKRLKSIKIDKYYTLYDLLLKDIDKITTRVKNPVFQEIMVSPNINVNFPIYGFLLKVQYYSGSKRRNCIDDAKEVFIKLLPKISLPDTCIENIFKYLSNTDLDNIIDTYEIDDDS